MGQVALMIAEEVQMGLPDLLDIQVAVAPDLPEVHQEVHTRPVVPDQVVRLQVAVVPDPQDLLPAQEALRLPEVPEDNKSVKGTLNY